jgi:uncharacterized membrane protein YecN with MAPEG domain
MSNTIFALWIGLSAALLLLFFYAAWVNVRRRQTRRVELGQLIPGFLPVDVEAFTALVASAPLSREQQRERMRRMTDWLRRMTHNAALLQQLGYNHINSSNQLISELAQQMVDAGVHVRLYTFIGLAVLRCWRLTGMRPLPAFFASKLADTQRMFAEDLVPSYQLLKDKAGNLTCLKFSAYHDALVQSL